MPDAAGFLCDWHVRKAWQWEKQQKVKYVKGQTERKELMKLLEELLRYNIANPGRYANEQLRAMGKQQLEAFYRKHKDLTAFIHYFKTHWEGNMGASFEPFCWHPGGESFGDTVSCACREVDASVPE